MKTNPDTDRDDTLLEAVLRDEEWQTASAAMKAEAMGTLHTRRRRRRLTRWAAGSVAMLTLALSAAHWFDQPEPVPAPVAKVSTEHSAESSGPHYLTDDELLASFPAGSCMLVEVDGREELVFLNPEAEHKYLSRAEQPVN
jgi:hypothetical protein